MVDKKTILLVEDDSSLQGPLAERLAAEGFNVLKAQDGAAGLEAAFKDHPDLILTDIVLTNMSNLDNISEALKNEVFDYIVKSDTSLSQVVDKVKAKIAAG
jgi:DNA-binding response OmpR family regulator